MSVDIEQLRDYWDANMAEWDEDRAAHIHGSLPELLDSLVLPELEATPAQPEEDATMSVKEKVAAKAAEAREAKS